MNIVIESIYPTEDDFGCGEYGVRVVIDGKRVAEYGDYYHDKGSEKALGFIDGYCAAKGRKVPKVAYADVVDPDCC